MTRRLDSIALCILLLVSHSSMAAEQHAHVHGAATLQVAVDGATLSLNLSSPLHNLLGFEHSPTTAKEKAAAADLIARLRTPAWLFVPTPSADCTLASTKIDAPVLGHTQSPTAQHGVHKEAGQRSAKHSAHDDEHDDDEHAELTVQYVFGCRHSESLRGVRVELFNAFPSVRKVEVQIAAPQGQSSMTLTRSRRLASW